MTTMLTPSCRSHAITAWVWPSDIDHMGHVNNAVYLRWVQDAVIAHWREGARADAVDRYLWIAIRHEINYLRPAYLGDVVSVETVARAMRGARATFTTIIRRGELVLCEVESMWCCLDAEHQRPARLPREIAAPFLDDTPYSAWVVAGRPSVAAPAAND